MQSLYIYEDGVIKYVYITNQLADIPIDYKIKTKTQNTTTYVKPGCIDICFVPVDDLDAFCKFLKSKVDQQAMITVYYASAWKRLIASLITKWFPFLERWRYYL